MKKFAISVFILHTLFEISFGLRAFIMGSFSSQTAEEVANQTIQLAISARFLGSALFALGVLGLIVLTGPGVRSVTGKFVCIAFALFHGVGTLGVLLSAMNTPSVMTETFIMGPLVIHGVLAAGFITILVSGFYRQPVAV